MVLNVVCTYKSKVCCLVHAARLRNMHLYEATTSVGARLTTSGYIRMLNVN